jgi:hypothetical protein
MTKEQFLERFTRLAANDHVGLEKLSRDVVEDARAAARAAVEVWSGYDPAQEKKAAVILSALDEIAFVPLTEKSDPPSPQHRVWLLRMAGLSHLELRAKLVALIDRMLDDRRTPPAGATMQGPPLEENPPAPRVCDEAYLVQRQLLNFQESREHYFSNARAFQNLRDDQKDVEIRNAKRSNVWKNLTGGPG